MKTKVIEIIVKNTKSNCVNCKGFGNGCYSWIYCEKIKELIDINGFDETGENDGCIHFIKKLEK